MNFTDPLVEKRFNLGIKDGRWLGHKNPQRSFRREDIATDKSVAAYFAGLAEGLRVTQWWGPVMRCSVHWDHPGFDTPACMAQISHVAIAEYPGGTHVICLCERHAKQAECSNKAVGTSQGFPYLWDIVPLSWIA